MILFYIRPLLLSFAGACLLPVSTAVFAQGISNERSGQQASPDARSLMEQADRNSGGFAFDAMPSLFFTPRAMALLNDARRGLVSRSATDFEIDQAGRAAMDGQPPARGLRELSVGGIIYTAANDWTVWLNGQKITPDRLPPEILDIQVQKNHVRLRWYDAYTNQIFPIKIKTQQRFNLDTRIFLPGS